MTIRPFQGMLVILAVVGAMATSTTAWAAENWSNYDWSREREVLSKPGETTEQALEEARRAVAASDMPISMSAVGFDIPAGSTAEEYLQKAAAAGGGGYYRAEAGGQLAQAMGAAATGRPLQAAPAAASHLQVGRSLQDGSLQGVADHFPSAAELWVRASYTDLPPNTRAECVWLRDGQPFMTSERVIGGTGWVAFSIKTGDAGGLPRGAYTVRITAGGRPLGERHFTIGPAPSGAANRG
jgi:hypothetical protein